MTTSYRGVTVLLPKPLSNRNSLFIANTPMQFIYFLGNRHYVYVNSIQFGTPTDGLIFLALVGRTI